MKVSPEVYAALEADRLAKLEAAEAQYDALHAKLPALVDELRVAYEETTRYGIGTSWERGLILTAAEELLSLVKEHHFPSPRA